MAELGTTQDPRALVPGDPDAVRASARSMTRYAGELREAGAGLRTLMTPAGWSGEAADAFRDSFEPQPPKWLEAGDCFTAASRALDIYAETLEWAQRQAAEAIRLWEQAQAATASARSAYDEQASRPLPPGAPPLGPFVDPGEAGRAHARDVLNRARSQLDGAGNTAADAVGAARDRAPEDRGFWGGLGHALGELGSDALDLGKEAVNGLASFGNAAIHHPGDVGAMALGAAGIVAGLGGEAGGGLLDASIVGAPAGVTLNIASAGLIGLGAGAVGAGAIHMAQSAAGEDRVTPLETGGGSGSGGSSEGVGPKPVARRPPISEPNTAQEKRLNNLMDNIYKGTKNPDRVGDGRTGDAVRNERLTGQPTEGDFHETKAQDTVNGLRNWLRRNPDAPPQDRGVAQNELDDLLDALGQ